MDIQYTREEYEEICSRTNRKDLITLHELCEKVSTDIEARCRQTQKKHEISVNEQGRYAFENAVHFMKMFAEYLPQAGVLAWDICEKIGFVRHAYRCGIIDRVEYCHDMMVFRDAAVENFSGWEEYMRSLIYGCGLYMYNFDMDESGVAGAIDFICMLTPMLLNSDLADLKWNQ